MPTERHPRDPWRKAPTSELQDQVLPRWFVLTAMAMVALALVTLGIAFTVAGSDALPLGQRRPPPGDGLTSAVGALQTGDTEPMLFEEACPTLQGIRVAGSDLDLEVLRQGLAALCDAPPEQETRQRLERFSRAGGVVRFALFERTGVDVTSTLADPSDAPVIYLNNKYARGNPSTIAPLIAYEVTFADRDPGEAEAVLAARRTEARVCERLLGEDARTRACQDARAILALPEPLEALRAAGFR